MSHLWAEGAGHVKTLKIGEHLRLPLDAATETFAIVGRRGSGKTHTAVVFVEELLGAGVQTIVLDPLDVWFGLRVSKDGKAPGLPIYVAGGAHEDIPLVSDAGKVLADVVVEKGLSIVLSLRHLSKGDQRRFVADFCERLYDRKGADQFRTALHVVLDEADAFVPQRLVPGAERTYGAVDTLVRRGRASGIATTLISQRPQVVAKDVLSQTEILVSHQLTGPQDRKAIEAWIEAHDTADRQAEFMASLASLPRGTAWFWSPGFLDIFRKVAVRDRHTFDSSATPKPGERALQPRAFAEVDLEKLTAEITATIEKAKADDPRELRKQIAEMAKQLGQLKTGLEVARRDPSGHVPVKTVLTEADRALLSGLTSTLTALRKDVGDIEEHGIDRLRDKIADLLNSAHAAEQLALRARVDFAIERLERAGFQKILDKLAAVEPHPHTPATLTPRPASPQGRRTVPAATVSRPAPLVSPDGSLGPAERKMLAVLAQRQGKATSRNQLAVFSGYSASSRHVDNTISALRSKGLVCGDRAGLAASLEGLSVLGEYDPLPTGPALIDYWVTHAGGPAEAAMLRALVEVYPGDLTRDTLAEYTGYSVSSRHVDNTISRLRTLELITGGRAALRASDDLFQMRRTESAPRVQEGGTSPCDVRRC